MDNTIERVQYQTIRKVKWGKCGEFTIIEIFNDGPEEREMQKKALEILMNAPVREVSKEYEKERRANK